MKSNLKLKKLVEAAKKKIHLQEQLVPVNLEDLKLQIQDDPYLEELLTVDSNKLPAKYRYLVDEEFRNAPSIGGMTLYKLIKDSRLVAKETFFSKTDDKITGWVAYIESDEDPDKVENIKMFSFDLNSNNVVLTRDLLDLLKYLLKKYKAVSWKALAENPANKAYEKIVKKYNGEIKYLKNGKVSYTIYSSIL